MSTLTSPDSIEAHDDGDSYDPSGAYSALATSVQRALLKRQGYTFVWANVTDRSTQIGMRSGDLGYQTDTGVTYRYTGTVWAVFGNSNFASYTPTLSNITLGTGGTNVAQWRYVGDRVEVEVAIKLGTSGMSVGTDPGITLPVPAATPLAPYQAMNGIGNVSNSVNNIYPIVLCYSNLSTTAAVFFAFAPTTSGYVNVNSTTPATFAASWSFTIAFSYRAA